MIPTWLQRHLEQVGRWNTDGISRSLAGTSCRRCGKQVLCGLDDDVAALAVTADPQPVSRVGEVLALVAGRRTFSLDHYGGRWVVNARYPERIRSPNFGAVLAEHACHSPPLPTAPQPPQATRPVASQEPPF